MFDLGWSELLLVAVVALVVIGPKDLPIAMRQVGKWVGKARAMTRHVRAGFDEMVRQTELEEMEKEWREHNKAIMAATPGVAFESAPAAPLDPSRDYAGEPPPSGFEGLMAPESLPASGPEAVPEAPPAADNAPEPRP
jgi:sec-independent protein translocase protein TatB